MEDVTKTNDTSLNQRLIKVEEKRKALNKLEEELTLESQRHAIQLELLNKRAKSFKKKLGKFIKYAKKDKDQTSKCSANTGNSNKSNNRGASGKPSRILAKAVEQIDTMKSLEFHCKTKNSQDVMTPAEITDELNQFGFDVLEQLELFKSTTTTTTQTLQEMEPEPELVFIGQKLKWTRVIRLMSEVDGWKENHVRRKCVVEYLDNAFEYAGKQIFAKFEKVDCIKDKDNQCRWYRVRKNKTTECQKEEPEIPSAAETSEVKALV